MEEEDPELFKAYYTRLILLKLITLFNKLLRDRFLNHLSRYPWQVAFEKSKQSAVHVGGRRVHDLLEVIEITRASSLHRSNTGRRFGKEVDWEYIASQSGLHRSGMSCWKRYYRIKDREIHYSELDFEEFLEMPKLVRDEYNPKKWYDSEDEYESEPATLDGRNQPIPNLPIQVPQIPLDELKEITNNFGVDAHIGYRSYEKVSIASSLKHPNVTALLGCCINLESRILVYEYATIGTLHELLHGCFQFLTFVTEAGNREAADPMSGRVGISKFE
ncbi:hypothetical protein CRG98_028729 [Punica granatum]|uniref:Serine-threonine/tyrosine-protein kinase catalytic domain-containing protein n=1 Tax=Punica granatum TaxID=22663 RepID=A0A2I0J3S3_PUNGR|nr:hypothetical protein CRG98_028729 [Punica granatum]